jgi:hypothetical protein
MSVLPLSVLHRGVITGDGELPGRTHWTIEGAGMLLLMVVVVVIALLVDLVIVVAEVVKLNGC